MFISNVKNQKNSILSLFFVSGAALLLSLIAGLLLSSSAMAKMSTDTPPTDRAISYSYWKATSKCVTDHMRSSIMTTPGENGATSPKQGNFPDPSGQGGFEGTKEGEWFDDRDAFVTVYPNGNQDCAQVMAKALKLWGITDYRKFLEDMGYKYNSNIPALVRSNDSGQKRFDSFKSAVLKNVGNVVDLLNKEAKYSLYKGLFESNKAGLSSCDGKKIVKLTEADKTQRDAARNNEFRDGVNYTVIKVVDGTNNDEYVYTYSANSNAGGTTNASTTNYASTWNYRGANYPGATGEHFKCKDLIRMINDNATAFSMWNRNHPTDQDSGIPETTDECATDEAACENVATTCAIEAVGWIVCPVTSFLASVADNAYSFLSDNFLQVDASSISTSSPTYTVWTSMRTIANIAFVIAFLFIIFSQLTGQGVSNYGIKKLLPRLIVAAILVNVSFFICQLAVDISNLLGVSIRQVFGSVGDGISLPEVGADDTGNWVGIATGVIAGAGIAWALGISVLGPFLLAAVIAFIMVFLILVVRQVLIVLLIVISPIAFVAFLLPNTEQWFTKWRKMFVALLIVFPLIGLLFGAAGLASSVIDAAAVSETGGSPDDTEGVISQIIAAGVIALPLFLLPGLLKRSLDGVGNIGQTMNNLGDKFGRGASKKLGDSGVMRALDQRKKTKRAQIGAGIYSGWNPLNKGRSAINAQLNKSRAYNAVTGNYGTIRGANIEKLENDETKLAEASVQLEARTGASVDAQFASAIERGDIVKARAAQNILMKSGSSGVMKVRDTIANNESRFDDKMRTALSSNITENHGQVAKQKANDLLQWSVKGGSTELSAVSAAAATWGGLSARELSDLPDASFQRAMQSGGVSKETIAALKSDRILENLSDGQRGFLATAKAYSPPAPATAREFNRETIRTMGVENVTEAVKARGGVEMMNEGDIISIINSHGGTPIADDARKEAIKRNIITETPKRDPKTMPKK